MKEERQEESKEEWKEGKIKKQSFGNKKKDKKGRWKRECGDGQKETVTRSRRYGVWVLIWFDLLQCVCFYWIGRVGDYSASGRKAPGLCHQHSQSLRPLKRELTYYSCAQRAINNRALCCLKNTRHTVDRYFTSHLSSLRCTWTGSQPKWKLRPLLHTLWT